MIRLLSDLVAAGRAPRFHGNGFTQLPLGSTRRLHVWHPSLPPIEGHNATIHNHVWDMQSRVLSGHLLHVTYSHADCIPDASATHDVYMLGESRPDAHRGAARMRVTGEYNMAAGSIYVFPEGQWHESHMAYPDVIVATLMEKRPARDGARPLVACPRGEHPVDAFAPEHQPSPDAMWRAIEEAIILMSPAGIREIEESVS